MKHIPLLLLFLFASCVLPQDRQDAREAQTSFEQEVAERLQELEEGAITRAEYDEAYEAAEEQRSAEFEEIRDRVEARTAAATSPVPITGHPGIDIALSLLGTAGAAAFGVNKYRNSKREKRGEPTA